MGSSIPLNVNHDDVYNSVQRILDDGTPLDRITLRMIRTELGERGSLTTIGKHYRLIKARLEKGEGLDIKHLTDIDMDALRDVVTGIVNQRTYLARRECDASVGAMADIVRGHEADLELKDEVIEDLEHQVEGLEGEVGAKMISIDLLEQEVARLTGMVDALTATIATLAPTLVAPGSTPSDHVVAEERQPSVTEVRRAKSGQTEMPLVASPDADKAGVDGDDQS